VVRGWREVGFIVSGMSGAGDGAVFFAYCGLVTYQTFIYDNFFPKSPLIVGALTRRVIFYSSARQTSVHSLLCAWHKVRNSHSRSLVVQHLKGSGK
jgi:hypothetical protein